MFLRAIRLQCLPLKPQSHALQSMSSLYSATQPGHSTDAVFPVSAILGNPGWQKSQHLKSLVSHMSPLSVSRVVAFHSSDILLCLDFFKWVCKHSTYCYDIDSRIQLMYLLASDKFYGIVHKVLVFLLKECCSSQDDLKKLIGAMGELREMRGFRINYPCYSTLLMRLAKLDMGMMAYTVFKRMLGDGFLASGIDYRMVINALCKNAYVQAAEMFFSRVLKLGFTLDIYVYASLVLGNCRAAELNGAFRVFGLMSEKDGCGVNSVTYSILVHGLCEAGRLDEACKLKEDMAEKHCQPSVHTYTVLIKAMCDRGLVDQAFNLLDEMIKNGCKPNVYTYTVIVDMLCREGKIEEANGMFRKMLKEGLHPGTVTYNALINGYCKEGRIISAFELLGVMERKHCKPNICTYNEIMEGLCKSGIPYKALALLTEVVNNGLFPTEVTFNILVVGLCRLGHLNTAFKILRSMRSFGVDPDQFTYTTFIDTFCKLAKLEQAEVILGLMIKNGISIDEVAVTALIGGYCKTGKLRSALLVFEKVAGDICLTSPHIFNIFLDVIGEEVNVGAKNAMLGKLIKYGFVPSVVTYTILVDGICRSGDANNCFRLLDLMRQAGCAPNVYTYVAAINGLCRSGKVEDAEILLLEMGKDGVSPNVTIYSLLIKSHSLAGRLTRAFDIMNTMLKKGCHPNTQIYIALLAGVLMLDAEDSERASICLAVLNSKSPMEVQTGVNCLPDFIFRKMDMQHAFQLLHKLKECGSCPVDAYKFLIMGLCRAGRISEADILIHEMVKQGLTPDTDICACIIKHFCKNGDYSSCVQWITKFHAYGSDLSLASYSAVIVGLQNAWRFQEAEQLILNLLQNANIEDQTAVLPYIGFLGEGQMPGQSFEFLDLTQQIGHEEKPVV